MNHTSFVWTRYLTSLLAHTHIYIKYAKYTNITAME